jgi:hypothetical protein
MDGLLSATAHQIFRSNRKRKHLMTTKEGKENKGRKNTMKNTIRNTAMTMFFVAALAIFIMPANAAVTVNTTTEINITVFVPCAVGGAGENVDVSGPLHVLMSFTMNGNNISGKFHFQPQGVTGTGETTGDKYQGTGVTQQTFTASLQNGQANVTFVNNFRIIGQGPGNNYLVHETMHITFNADGTVTVNFDNLSIDCK